MNKLNNKYTLWEIFQRKFYNSWVGVILLVTSLTIGIFFKLYDYKKTIDKDIYENKKESESKENNKRLLILNENIVTSINNTTEIDSISKLLQSYISIRNSSDGYIEPNVKEAETVLMNKLFEFAYQELKKVQANSNNFEAKTLVKKLKPFYNQLLDFCKKTNVCSDAYIETLKITLNELNKN